MRRAVIDNTIEERHYTIQELMLKWNLSRKVLRTWFETEPGVLRLSVRRIRPGKRRASEVSLRIPESVALRVYRERSRGPF